MYWQSRRAPGIGIGRQLQMALFYICCGKDVLPQPAHEGSGICHHAGQKIFSAQPGRMGAGWRDHDLGHDVSYHTQRSGRYRPPVFCGPAVWIGGSGAPGHFPAHSAWTHRARAFCRIPHRAIAAGRLCLAVVRACDHLCQQVGVYNGFLCASRACFTMGVHAAPAKHHGVAWRGLRPGGADFAGRARRRFAWLRRWRDAHASGGRGLRS